MEHRGVSRHYHHGRSQSDGHQRIAPVQAANANQRHQPSGQFYSRRHPRISQPGKKQLVHRYPACQQGQAPDSVVEFQGNYNKNSATGLYRNGRPRKMEPQRPGCRPVHGKYPPNQPRNRKAGEERSV